MEVVLKVVIIASITAIITTKYLMSRYLKKMDLLDKRFLSEIQDIVIDLLENWVKDKF